MRRAGLTLTLVAAAGLAVAAGVRAEKAAAKEWRAAGEVASYDRKTVFQAIDGAADLFLGYGLRTLREQTYAREKQKATVQIYEQGSPLDAFGVFARERPPGAAELKVGAGAASGKDGDCTAYRGARYVKAVALEGKLTGEACKALLAAVVKGLPGGDQRPRELGLLPASGQLAGTLSFTRGSFLGTRQLGDCVHADYRPAGGKPYTLFALIPTPSRSADALWRELAGKWRVERFGAVELASWRHPYRGTVGVLRRGGALLGAVGVGDAKATAALLEKLPAR